VSASQAGALRCCIPQMRGLLRAALAVALVAPATPFAFDAFPSVARWNFPSDPLLSEGLGRGISYSMDNNFCDTLLPHLASKSQTCADVQKAVARAFALWAAPNPFIHFYNATSVCGTQGARCPAAEIYVQAWNGPRGDNDTEVPIRTVLTTEDTLPRTTAGTTGAEGQRTITQAVVTIYMPQGVEESETWYMNERMCDEILKHTFDVKSLLGFLFALGMIIAIFLIFAMIFLMCYGQNVEEAPIVEGTAGTLPRAKTFTCPALTTWGTIGLSILIFALMLIPYVMYFGYFSPCLSQMPLEPALLHGIGAALGLQNVSAETARHLSMPDFCTSDPDPVNSVASVEGGFDPYFSAEQGACTADTWWVCDNRAASVMLTPDPTHTRTTSLAKDDLDALAVLYPSPYWSCGTNSSLPPVHSAYIYANWDMLLAFSVPLGLLMLILPAIVACCRGLKKCNADQEAAAAEAKAKKEAEEEEKEEEEAEQEEEEKETSTTKKAPSSPMLDAIAAASASAAGPSESDPAFDADLEAREYRM